jgi:glycosyltransferase involved in cell wall biosynthesis
MHRAFPDAPIFTALYDPAGTFPEFACVDLRTSRLNKVHLLRQNHRLALPLLASEFSAMRIDADLVICSSSGWAHGVRTAGFKIVYCHTPARWLYQSDAYLSARSALSKACMRLLNPPLRVWDQRAARTADRYVANSSHTKTMIERQYGLESTIVFPPAGVELGGLQEPFSGLEPGYFLCVSRLLAYKHIDTVIEAFRQLPGERLVVVGSGPEAPRLSALAGENVAFARDVTDAKLRWLYRNSSALIAASFEDFGLTPIEAAAFGRPTIALRYGGYLDTVREGVTGTYFDRCTPEGIVDAIHRLERIELDVSRIRRHADAFSERRFRKDLVAMVDQVLSPA